jgi:molybdopterin molybdotransferase
MATVPVHPRPRIGIIAVGDEVVTPGHPLRRGQLYASNVVVLRSWLRHFRMEAEMAVVGDDREPLAQQAAQMLERVDVLLTSGGAWKSDRDLTVDVLKALGADLVFHRVRMGPGKAVALLVKEGKVLFCLPGGPPSNEIAFLQIALPGLLRLAGRPPVAFETTRAVLTEPVAGDKDWTQFIYLALERAGVDDGSPVPWLARPLKGRSRLRSQAEARALFRRPEGIEKVDAGTQVDVQILHAPA